jgi:putative sterol carrier protein
MPGVATTFFEALEQRRYEPLLAHTKGTLAVELVDGDKTDRWLVSVDRGTMSVSRRKGRADCTVRGDRRLMERILTGEANAMAAFLRGELAVSGDPEFLVRFQRVFPGPPRDVEVSGAGKGKR